MVARMEFLKLVRKRSFLSELIYTVLNIALAVGVLLIVRYTEAIWLAIFLGMSALFMISYNWPVSIVVLGAWLIGYSAARHILSTYDDETHGLFMGLVWGLVTAEIAWVAYHWAIAYPLPIVPALMLPQAALLVTLVSFLAYKVYDSFYHHAKVRMSDVLLPLLFTISVIIVLLIVFNRVGTAI